VYGRGSGGNRGVSGKAEVESRLFAAREELDLRVGTPSRVVSFLFLCFQNVLC